ncbi:MAG: chromosomal replication initiator protein DnaA [Nitrospirae bacterium]|nr:chromosomal replication initiator protein DnaA [Nitrospirota bacterium]
MEKKELWQKTLSVIEEKIPPQGFEMWFKPIRLISFSEKEAEIEVPNRFFKEWIEERYQSLVTETLERISEKKDILLKISVSKKEKTENKTKEKNNGHINKKQRELSGTGVNPKYTFENFVVGLSNQFAHAAARAVAEKPAFSYNPLFIYGGVGLGKTHLMNAIGNNIINTNTKLLLKLAYMPSEVFTNELITSIRYQKMEDFRNKYRGMDILLMDDIQFIAGKERTQEEFFHTFNTLYETQKQIVISSDRFPKEMPEIEERLRSRFEWGLIADIQPPDLETKVAILEKKAELEGIKLPKDVSIFIASKIKTNIRELEGCLIRLGAYSALKKIEISLELAKDILKDVIYERERVITVEDIQKTVAENFGIKPQDMKIKRRTREIAFPRQIAMYLCRKLTNISLNEIGKHFGGKDHSTVIHSTKLIEDKIKRDEEIKEKIEGIIKTLKG